MKPTGDEFRDKLSLARARLMTMTGNQSDLGTVKARSFRYVTIKWQDGHESFTGHRAMQRVSLAEK